MSALGSSVGGPETVFGGKRFPVTEIPGGMYGMGRFLAYAFFYVLMPYPKLKVRFPLRQRYGKFFLTVFTQQTKPGKNDRNREL